MPRPKEVIDEELAEEARLALKELKDHKLCIRLQAIMSSCEHAINDVASIVGVSRQTLWRWIKAFRESGVEGLKDRPRGHRPSKLNEEELNQVARWLEEGTDSRGEPVHWTLFKLQAEIERQFGVRMGITPIWRRVRMMGFRQKVPRPFHAKGNEAIQRRFKKNRSKGR